MTKTKHTPGPWDIDDLADVAAAVIETAELDAEDDDAEATRRRLQALADAVRKLMAKAQSNTVKRIGEIGVDAGLCWIGDPCYILHADPKPKAIGNDWSGFCDILQEDKQYPTAKQFAYDLGHAGLGVCVSTGYGDGVYPVYAELNGEGRTAKVWVEFIADDDNGEEGD
jgi:hypothetical protein